MSKERELLRRALEALNDREAQLSELGYGCLMARLLEDDILAYLAYLASEPESDEPVAWSVFDGEGGYDYISYENNETYKDEFISRNRAEHYKEWVQPLYTRPAKPERKPMTQEEIDKGFSLDWFYGSFVEGIRFAERHHGIGGES